MLVMSPDKRTRHPRLYISNMMTRAHYEVERYRWDEYKAGGRSYKPKVIKDEDDYVDCMLAAAMLPPPDFDNDVLMEPEVFFKY